MVRSIWKGPFIEKHLLNKLNNKIINKIILNKQNNIKKNKTIPNINNTNKNKQNKNLNEFMQIWSRKSIIIPDFIDMKFSIYNGKSFNNIKISDNMIGHKFGEFSITKIKCVHINKNKK